MGSLIVLLVLLLQQARVDAVTEVENETPPVESVTDSQKIAAEDAQWLFDQLTSEREFLKEEVEQQANILSHLESHVLELEEQARRLHKTSATMTRMQNGEQADQIQLEQEHQVLTSIVSQAREDLNEVQESVRNRPPEFAIVPYLGTRGTHRRPVYIECVQDAVIIQPEGVRIAMDDFGGIIGPGNPLDAALRTIREFYRMTGGGGVPYPLLVVRPEGTSSYGVARAAMRTWDDEFGYELIDTNLELKFSKENQSLAEELEKAIALARRRQAALAQAMPSAYGRGRGNMSYVASRTGGFVAADSNDEQINQIGSFGQSNQSHLRDGGRGSTEESEAKPPPVEMTQNGTQAAGNHSRGNAHARGGLPANDRNNRKENWGLPESPRGSIGITRPIRITLKHDRLIIHSDAGVSPANPTIIRMHGPLEGHVHTILTSIWSKMDTWGLAVVGGYWQPVLKIQVEIGGERRYLEFDRSFRNSGLMIKRVSQ